MTPEESLERLLAGNRRFADRVTTHAYAAESRRDDLLDGQHPFATVLGCSDSRVPVELVFDQGLGDVFVIRNAGHIVGESVLGSLEFAVTKLGCPLIVVLGHSQCGAVAAAMQARKTSVYPEGHIASIVRAIEPVVQSTADADTVMRAHVIDCARHIEASSTMLVQEVTSGTLWIVAAEYQLATQRVNVLVVRGVRGETTPLAQPDTCGR